ncbi:MBL fold metallo-hydrolase [uncultured Bacteroides sp.]|uniref:MBL fold metallo-hydrolase n=1 Tax=uncultured Bacteroides sp. TaxID=162156 RepID=UPI002AAB82EE|nr:MBL fold metallo-hydrolase [uncultured Bacteroides sp.]
MKKNIKNNVYWVGKNDWEIRNYQSYEYSTRRGTSYNSYLIQEEKTVLIDTVLRPFSAEFVKTLAKNVDLLSIDYIICTHSEPDHSGALPDLMSLIPNVPIYCTEDGKKSLLGNYHQDWNFRTVKSGEKLSLGNGKELIFFEIPLNYWPDNMFCYLTQDHILFSNGIFGQHLCTELLFNDLVDQCELNSETIKYYANIMQPIGKLITKKIDDFLKKNLQVDMICPSHGVIWRDNPLQVITKYLMWGNNYHENQITIIYDTVYSGTYTIAQNIAKGIHSADERINIKLFNASKNDKNDMITEVFRSKGVLVGSPCLNQGILGSVSIFLEMIRGFKFSKKAAVFGCYGWKDTSIKIMETKLKEAGFDIVMEPISFNWFLTDEALDTSTNYGWLFYDILSRSE